MRFTWKHATANSNVSLGGKLEDKELRKYASQAGLDLGRFDHEMSINLYAEEILRNLEFSINHGITGTPTFFVNDVLWAVTGVKLIESVKALAERPGSVKDTETN